MIRLLFILLLYSSIYSIILPSDYLKIRHITIDILDDINSYNKIREYPTFKYILHDPLIKYDDIAKINVTILSEYMERHTIEFNYIKKFNTWFMKYIHFY